ncbi:hypothetical protein precursor [Tribolium castaneum]|uniref:CCHamide 2 n=1 Tax=Tribolium castaneum TaxID=7070 RepID=S4S8D5_TRICA|nr:hypothetical protein precursor [Tribolium castaneum]AFJ23970.1 CCHamide 2 precursor [Tribolium castaneum]|eukprot:NP_001280509.1 uncharacterized LOC103312182 precursor [Tribolium castaneum]
MNCWSTQVVLLAFVMAFVLAAAEAKRGCATFGHSCYGGMGKRTENNNEELLQDVQSEENPAFVFTGPRSENQQKLTPEQYDNISRVIRQWDTIVQESSGNAPRL